MEYEPRTIAFQCDLFHPPQAPDLRAVQKVHNELFESGQPAYASFAPTPGGPVLANPAPRPGVVSSAAFLADRFQFREEHGSLTHDEFAARVRQLAARVAALRGMQIFTAQQVVVRSLINPRSFRDSRAFLSQGVFRFEDETRALGAEPQLYGLRLVLPPGPAEGGDAATHALRVESYNLDPRSLFLEERATYGPVLVARGMEVVAERIEAAYRQLVERVLPFVARFDVCSEARGDGNGRKAGD